MGWLLGLKQCILVVYHRYFFQWKSSTQNQAQHVFQWVPSNVISFTILLQMQSWFHKIVLTVCITLNNNFSHPRYSIKSVFNIMSLFVFIRNCTILSNYSVLNLHSERSSEPHVLTLRCLLMIITSSHHKGWPHQLTVVTVFRYFNLEKHTTHSFGRNVYTKKSTSNGVRTITQLHGYGGQRSFLCHCSLLCWIQSPDRTCQHACGVNTHWATLGRD